MIKNKVDQVVELLQNRGRVQKNELVRLIVKEGLMSHDTANKTIDEGVKTHRIIRQDSFKGKQKIAFFTVHSDISENEKYHLEQLEILLEGYDVRYKSFIDNFVHFTTTEKALTIDRFFLFLQHYYVTVNALWIAFRKTRKWATLRNEIISRQNSLNDFIVSRPNSEQGRINRIVIERKFLYLQEAIDLLDKHLNELKK